MGLLSHVFNSDGSMRRQDGPKMAQESPKRGPRGPQEGPKSAEERPKSGPRGAQDALFEPPKGRWELTPPSFFQSLRAFIGPSWGHLGPSWGHLGPS